MNVFFSVLILLTSGTASSSLTAVFKVQGSRCVCVCVCDVCITVCVHIHNMHCMKCTLCMAV